MASPSLNAGAQVGEYEIIREIGRGGMGVVYLGQHPIIRKRVAIKVLASAAHDPEMEARFVQEARAANDVGHAGIVDVFAFGRLPSGALYLVMDFLEGESLETRLQREGRISPQDAAALFDPVCDTLQAAHARGIVHRDLKPDNIYLVARTGAPPEIKLLDFGIAKLLDPDESLTQTTGNQVFGTPLYMSPEQARAGGLDGQSDVYSLGVILYRALTGRFPIEGRNAFETLHLHQSHQPERPSTLVPLPAQLDELVVRCLAKEPAARPSLQEIREGLRASAADPVRTRRLSPWLIYGSTGLFAGGLALGAMALVLKPHTGAPRLKAGAANLPAPEVTAPSAREIDPPPLPPIETAPTPVATHPPPVAKHPPVATRPAPAVSPPPPKGGARGGDEVPPARPPPDDEDSTIEWAPQRAKSK